MAVESLVTDAAKELAKWVATRALVEYNMCRDFKNQLEKLNQRFESIHAFLEAADNSKDVKMCRMVKQWVDKIKDAAYMADNVMDEYAIEIFRRKMELKNRFKKKFRNLFTLSNPVFFRLRMAHKVKDILSVFDELDKHANRVGINQVQIALNTSNGDDQLREDRQHAAANASEFVGRENDEAELLDNICSLTKQGRGLSTAAIVGMAGLGKTALARRLNDHEIISTIFGDNKIWICVPEDFSIKKILNEMVEMVTLSSSNLSNTGAIVAKLQQKYKGKKLLLVFDDVWNEDKDSWRSLKELLNKIGTATGSVILVTTRMEEVAKAAEVVFRHNLEGLSIDEGWSLLHQIVSSDSAEPILPGQEKVGRRIVEMCEGVPLAVKVIGNLLRSKKQLCEWESIEKTHWDDGEKYFPWLRLSYNHLPSSSVKQCFAYCAISLKGFYMCKYELIGLWLSQGYLHNDTERNLTVDDIAEENLKILVSNSLLEERVPQGHKIVCYKMHGLVCELGGRIFGSKLIKEAKDLPEKGGYLHLDFKLEDDKTKLDFPSPAALMKLRTVLFSGKVHWNMLTHTRYLRTLYLDHTGITELPSSIKLLKHLRYLDVSYNPITTLPDSIGKLYQLQTLILQGCGKMKKLPKVLNKLVNLRYILTTAPMFAWKGLQQLTNLRSLPCLSLEDDGEGWTVNELGDLHELRDEIHIVGLECVKDRKQASEAGLRRKVKVTKLSLSWRKGLGEASGGISDKDVLDGFEPHPNIVSLDLQNFSGEQFPGWITGMTVLTEAPQCHSKRLDNLTEVKLINCISCRTLPTLGNLPHLKCLILNGFDVEFIGIEFYGGEDLDMRKMVFFNCLTELEISEFRRLVTWMEPPEEAFPHLETLRIRDCKRLKSVPVLGVKSSTSQELEISMSNRLNPRMQPRLVESPNPRFSWITTWMQPSRFSWRTTWMQPEPEPDLEPQLLDSLPAPRVPGLGMTSLKSLELDNLLSVESLDIIKYNSALTSLVLNKLSKIKSLPQELANCSKLQILHISECDELASLPEGLESLINLVSINVSYCKALTFIMSDLLHVRSSLRVFEIFRCQGLRKIPSSLEKCTSLATLMILNSQVIEGSPTNISMLQCLSELTMGFKTADHLRSVLKSAKGLPLLRTLEIQGFRDEEEMREYFSDVTTFVDLPSLTVLVLEGFPNIRTFPERLSYLTQIEALHIRHFDDLQKIQDWICKLESLDTLVLEHCKNLECLPSKTALKRLTYLGINKCPQLAEKYAKVGDPEWDKISHIKQIIINGETIQDLDNNAQSDSLSEKKKSRMMDCFS